MPLQRVVNRVTNASRDKVSTYVKNWLPTCSFSPLVASECVLWLSAESVSGTDGSLVSSWPDSSSVNNSLSQNTELYKPTLKTNVVSGHPIVRFPYLETDYRYMSFSGDVTETPIHIFAVLKPIGNAGVLLSRDQVGGMLLIIKSSSRISLEEDLGGYTDVIGQSTSGLSWVTFNYIDISFDNYRCSFRINGADAGSTVYPTSVDPFLYLCKGFFPNYGFTGDIAELAIYNKILVTEERDAIENWLKTRYSL